MVTLFNKRVSALKVIVAITSLLFGIGLAILLKITKQPFVCPFGKTTSNCSKFLGGLQRIAGGGGVPPGVDPPVTDDGVTTPPVGEPAGPTGAPGAVNPLGVIDVPTGAAFLTVISLITIVLPLYLEGLLKKSFASTTI